jgi:hypothetical protein
MEEEKSREELWAEVAAERGEEQPATKPTEVTPEPAQPEAANAEPAQAQAEAQPEPTPEPAKPTTEELLAQALARVEKLEGRTRNVEGHIGGLTSQQKALQETVAAARSAAAEVKDAPTDAQVKAAASNPKEWEKLKEDFPEWSNATESFLNARLANVKAGMDEATVNKMLSEVEGKITQKVVDSALSAVFPTWKQDINTEEFQGWVQAQPDDIKALAASSEVGDAARMLSLYNESKKANPVQQVLDQRKQKLQASVAAPRGTKPAVAKSWEQMTPEERWNYEAKSRERANAFN